MRSILILLVARAQCTGLRRHRLRDEDSAHRLVDVNDIFLKAVVPSSCVQPEKIQEFLEAQSPKLASLVKKLKNLPASFSESDGKSATESDGKSAFAKDCTVQQAGLKNLEEHTVKYAIRKCSNDEGMWGSIQHAEATKCKFDRISSLFGLKAGFKLLDWGAGCGENLNYLGLKSNVSAFGVDLIPANVAYGKKLPHVTDYFVTPKISSLACFPAESFDVIVSNGAVFHLDKLEQCNLWKDQFIRILKPGGCTWHGWYNTDGEYINLKSHMQDCLGDDFNKIELLAVTEQKLFGVSEYGRENAESLIVCKK